MALLSPQPDPDPLPVSFRLGLYLPQELNRACFGSCVLTGLLLCYNELGERTGTAGVCRLLLGSSPAAGCAMKESDGSHCP